MEEDTFILMLMEHLQKPESWLIEHAPQAAGDPPHLDVELLTDITHYIVAEEEWFGDFSKLKKAQRDERIEEALMVGLFIYGFQQWKYHGEDLE